VQTARLYTDLGLFTCNAEITEDLVEMFHYLTGRSLQRNYRKLIVAPVEMRERFMAMIQREIEHRAAGRPAQIIAKMNALEDRKICRALHEASKAGVQVDLIVRGFCCLRPAVPGLSENIRVISVVGRYLEHSRIFYFRNGAENPIDGAMFIGSADWMYRNLLHRVEAVVPVEDRGNRERLWEILQVLLNDNRSAWDMRPDGSYVQRKPAAGETEHGTQQTLMSLTRQRSASSGAADGK
jgi:polyphosphate kinase